MENFNMDFTSKVVINSAEQPWLESPMAGVERKPLARENRESGHATSIVRYQTGANFSAHQHPLGEEIFVLEGVFSDEHGDYPAGSYIRNPPGSSHSPFSKEGCVLFVKLNQFDRRDGEEVRVNTLEAAWRPGIGGLQVMPLHDFEGQHTALVKWPANEVFQPHQHFGGEEILVLSGQFEDQYGQYPVGSWIRSPHQSSHHPFVVEETVILVKVGHLMPAP
ncbi:cupin domain-containing protein [Sinobacterium norvegicum]|uniref:cupin domain-containing protein n=1 Tax=Sinobacterium norvegicum TaxID=1641715 RepID=UPI001F35A755|nr:cupin domain-containing protein [Sinobacterium norvegicum]